MRFDVSSLMKNPMLIKVCPLYQQENILSFLLSPLELSHRENPMSHDLCFCLQCYIFIARVFEKYLQRSHPVVARFERGDSLDFTDILLAPTNTHSSLQTKPFHHVRDFFICTWLGSLQLKMCSSVSRCSESPPPLTDHFWGEYTLS